MRPAVVAPSALVLPTIMVAPAPTTFVPVWLFDPERMRVPVPRAVRPIALVTIWAELVELVAVVLTRLLVRVKLPPEASKPRMAPFDKPFVLAAYVLALSRFASNVFTVLVVKAPEFVPTPRVKVAPPFTTMLEAVQEAVLAAKRELVVWKLTAPCVIFIPA